MPDRGITFVESRCQTAVSHVIRAGARQRYHTSSGQILDRGITGHLGTCLTAASNVIRGDMPDSGIKHRQRRCRTAEQTSEQMPDSGTTCHPCIRADARRHHQMTSSCTSGLHFGPALRACTYGVHCRLALRACTSALHFGAALRGRTSGLHFGPALRARNSGLHSGPSI